MVPSDGHLDAEQLIADATHLTHGRTLFPEADGSRDPPSSRWRARRSCRRGLCWTSDPSGVNSEPPRRCSAVRSHWIRPSRMLICGLVMSCSRGGNSRMRRRGGEVTAGLRSVKCSRSLIRRGPAQYRGSTIRGGTTTHCPSATSTRCSTRCGGRFFSTRRDERQRSIGSINGELTTEVRYRRAGQQKPSTPTSTPCGHLRVADIGDRCHSRSRARRQPASASSHALAASSQSMLSRTDVAAARALPIRASVIG